MDGTHVLSPVFLCGEETALQISHSKQLKAKCKRVPGVDFTQEGMDWVGGAISEPEALQTGGPLGPLNRYHDPVEARNSQGVEAGEGRWKAHS
jgi:hypothetical protein